MAAGHNSVERAYAALRDLAVTFAAKPGTRINESELSAELGMSRAPIREALNRLTADGLVRFEPGRGFYCRKLSVLEITDLFAARRDLELGALHQSVAEASDADIAALQRWWHGIIGDETATDIDVLVEHDETFHLALAALAGNAPRQSFLRNINHRIRFVRRINLEERNRRVASMADHAHILDALAARDGGAAARCLTHHLALTADEARRHVETVLARIYSADVA